MVRGCGAILLNKPKKLVEIVGAMTKALNSRQVTVKIRTGWDGES
jgi:tRNA-dihydrouridine synthase